jgi:hypothetical protein
VGEGDAVPQDDPKRVAMWSVIIVAALLLIGILFLCGQCIGDPIWEDRGPRY